MTTQGTPTSHAVGADDVGTLRDVTPRLIDSWFPCPEIDLAVGTPAGSGLSEKALFTWFASRPIAQARAATLCSLLSDSVDNRQDVRAAVLSSDPSAIKRLRQRITEQYGDKPPVVLDMFSGRGILPLEAARAGATALGTDVSPVATLAGRVLADFPLRDWSAEPVLPWRHDASTLDPSGSEVDGGFRNPTTGMESLFDTAAEPRLLMDVRSTLLEVGRRVAKELTDYYPGSPTRHGEMPWAYTWAVTVPCDGCARRFPLFGSAVLRHPYKRTQDAGQAFQIVCEEDAWRTRVHDGLAVQEPTYTAPEGRRGKSAKCPFPDCGYVHGLSVIKAKGLAGQYSDSMLAVAEIAPDTNQKIFREPRPDEVAAAARATKWSLPARGSVSSVPDEAIPETAGVDARQYGFLTYGALMNPRQQVMFGTTARVIDDLYGELCENVSHHYASALACYAAATLTRQIRRSTRGARLASRGNPTGAEQNRVYASDIFTKQSVIAHGFDYVEVGPGLGPATWSSVSQSLLNALAKIFRDSNLTGQHARLRRASATALPFRDATVDAVICDPPYYDMIAYADSSDIFHVWFKRALLSAMPDLFGGTADGADGLQDKSEEIIVKGRGAKGKGDHRTVDFYEQMLARAFSEARRVLKANGHMTVIFGHSDPEAWKRLLGALTDAGFVVTSSWPSRTETAVTGVATISVTVSIGARVAPAGRPVGIAAQVDAEVVNEVKSRCRGWDFDGLALEDQLMASYGAALQVVGNYSKVITPSGDTVPLEHYMTLARRAVRDAIALRLDEQPLETFDPHTRLAIFWHELYGRDNVPKGEARFFAQSDELRLEDLRGPILEETRAGFRLRHDTPERLTPKSSAYEVVRGMAADYSSGTDAVAACLAAAERPATDAHVWALVDWLATKLPSSDAVAVALSAVKRNRGTIQASVATQIAREKLTDQPTLFEENS